MNSEKSLLPSTKLSELGLPFLEIVLAEKFLLPPESLKRFGMPVPLTISELAEASGMPLDEVIKIVLECLDLNEKIWLGGVLADYFARPNMWVVDMRPYVTFECEPLHADARIFHLGNPAAQLEIMRTLEGVVVLSKSIAHAWSAAMSLRCMGITAYVVGKSP